MQRRYQAGCVVRVRLDVPKPKRRGWHEACEVCLGVAVDDVEQWLAFVVYQPRAQLHAGAVTSVGNSESDGVEHPRFLSSLVAETVRLGHRLADGSVPFH